MVEALGGFDPQKTYDEASLDYDAALADFWAHLSTRTVERLGLRPGERVLDVPCGTGPSLVPAAQRVGPAGRVVGMDFAGQMLSIARSKVEAGGVDNVELTTGDMTAIPPPAEPFDAVLCVLGVFFVDDMPGLVRSLHDLTRPGSGRLAVTVFAEGFFEPLGAVFVEAATDVMPGVAIVQPWRRTATVDLLQGVFDDAGVGPVTIETDEDRIPLASPDDLWRIVIGSGLRRVVAALGPERAAEVRARCAAYVTDHGIDHVVVGSRYAIATRA